MTEHRCSNCKWGKRDGGIPPYTCIRPGMDTYGQPHTETHVCDLWAKEEFESWKGMR